jgi:hypothetical protein
VAGTHIPELEALSMKLRRVVLYVVLNTGSELYLDGPPELVG